MCKACLERSNEKFAAEVERLTKERDEALKACAQAERDFYPAEQQGYERGLADGLTRVARKLRERADRIRAEVRNRYGLSGQADARSMLIGKRIALDESADAIEAGEHDKGGDK